LKLHGPLARRHRARLVGSGDDLIVFSHGFGSDQSAWKALIDQFPPRFTAISYDLPGAGPLLPEHFDPGAYAALTDYADDLIALLDEIGVERCIYVGHSVSGMIGVLAGVAAPERFRQLVLINGSPRYLNDAGYHGGFAREDLDGLFGAMAANYAAWVAGFAPLVVGEEVPRAVEAFSAGLLAMRPDVTLRVARTIFESDYRELLPALTVPTLLVHSRNDVAVPRAVADYLRSHIRGSDLVWIEADGHLPHLTAPRQLYEAIRARIAPGELLGEA
jgi:pimeloyl-ACP methyl ester carboxylesterase